MKFQLVALVFAIFLTNIMHSQDLSRKIEFPDIEGFKTLKTDLHIHTVFSDGQVWPNIRIQEAVKDGLDAISLTEHLEYQPHAEDIPHPDRNRSYIIAKEQAKAYDLLIIHGAEITRRMPPGHSNALFIQDANKLMISDSLEVFEEAARQGAFVFWNHPDWIQQRGDGIVTLTDFHRLLIEKNLLHGIEVVNDLTMSKEALQVAEANNLTPIGTSDIHGLVDYQFRLDEGGHRPISLVFAKERTVESIKEALFEGRSVAWFKNTLIGNEKWLKELIRASISASYQDYIGPSSILQVDLENKSDARYILENRSEYSLQRQNDVLELLPHSKLTLYVKTLENKDEITLKFGVLNAKMLGSDSPEIEFIVKK